MTEQMEPLSAAQMDGMRKRVDAAIQWWLDYNPYGLPGDGPFHIADAYRRDVPALLAEVERLRAALAARDGIVRAVANSVIPYTTPGEDAIGVITGSVVKQGRALLAASEPEHGEG